VGLLQHCQDCAMAKLRLRIYFYDYYVCDWYVYVICVICFFFIFASSLTAGGMRFGDVVAVPLQCHVNPWHSQPAQSFPDSSSDWAEICFDSCTQTAPQNWSLICVCDARDPGTWEIHKTRKKTIGNRSSCPKCASKSLVQAVAPC
jgi:hypothetical protein